MTASSRFERAHRLVDELVSLIAPQLGLVALARAETAKARLRQKLAGYKADDICWNMLLDLYVSEAEGREISVTSACIASMAPQTTALRKITHLEQVGLVERTPDKWDGRRMLMTLSPHGRRVVGDYLENSYGHESTSSTGS